MKARNVELNEFRKMVENVGIAGKGTDVNPYAALNVATKPKRRNGRISWKQRALAAESEAQVYLWVGLLLTVASFFIGVNVGLYGF